MKILVTGAAGFIGFHTCLKFVNQGHEVYGIDNINDYYDPKLKFDRLKKLGFDKVESKRFNNEVKSVNNNGLRFSRIDLVDDLSINNLFEVEKFDVVCNLAAQAGVRYSIKKPKAYIDSNIIGFFNILEACRNHKVKHLIFASSSSVYGENKKVPFEINDNVDHPISLYAATKKSNELMAHTYSHLYNIKTTGLRFFTVYGPWGRPDMAIYLFADAISKNRSIKVFNNGKMSRDFTYIDDIVNGIEIILENPPEFNDMKAPYKIFNIGNGKSETLLDFIKEIEICFGLEAKKEYLLMQAGDVPQTWSDISELKKLGYNSTISIKEGVKKFVEWYSEYHNIYLK
tara:strand:+ start:3975 stop:5003 length:1029 start_codon:yes stop_codon:yes gene_type:complete